MPIYEFSCQDCGTKSEILIIGAKSSPECRSCGSQNMKKLLSAPSSLSGVAKPSMPASACCGVSPDQAGCAGPGSCCGKNMNMT